MEDLKRWKNEIKGIYRDIKNERIDQEAEVNYVILYNPDKKYIKFEVE